MGRQTSRRLRPQTFLENISPKIHQIQSGSEIFDTLAPTLREKKNSTQNTNQSSDNNIIFFATAPKGLLIVRNPS